jgi:hypothetical protein
MQNDTAVAPTVLDAAGNVVKKRETWLREDWRHLIQAQQYCNSRNVGVAIICALCSQPLLPVETEGDGSVIVACACTERTWRR